MHMTLSELNIIMRELEIAGKLVKAHPSHNAWHGSTERPEVRVQNHLADDSMKTA